MPIENDRSFDKIFDEVELIKVPPQYIESVLVTFSTEETLEFDSLEHATEVIKNLEEGLGVLDISVRLDHDLIRDEVTTEIKAALGKFFKDE